MNPYKKIYFRFFLLAILLLLSMALFLTINTKGQWAFILSFRGKKLLMLLVAACAIGVSTLLFQTLTNNPILTPSILGFDSLYILLQTSLVFSLGVIGYSQLNELFKFLFEMALMIAASIGLFNILLKDKSVNYQQDLAQMVLIGVVFGVLFKSMNQLLLRLLDPLQFAVIQTEFFADFTIVKTPMIWIALPIVICSFFIIWQRRHILDVVALGQQTAINLGVEYNRITIEILIYITILLATATALVGPVSFFGLLACALTNITSPSISHTIRLPMVFVIAAITLVLGQTIFEHFFGMRSALSTVIEFIGGIVFLIIIASKHKGRV